MIYLANAFSMTMIDQAVEIYHERVPLTIERIGPRDTRQILRAHPNFISAYGHDESIRWLRELLHVDVQMSRRSIKLHKGDLLIIAAAYYYNKAYKREDNHRPFFVFHIVKYGRKSSDQPAE